MNKDRARETAIAILGEPLGRQVVDMRVESPTEEDQRLVDGSKLTVGDKITFVFGEGSSPGRSFVVSVK